MIHYSDYFSTQVIPADKPAWATTDLRARTAYLVGADKKPRHEPCVGRLLVNTHACRDAEMLTPIFEVLAMAGETRPIKVRTFSDLNNAFWTKITYNLKLFILNPAVQDRIETHPMTRVVVSDLIPTNRIICVGPPDTAGTVVRHGPNIGFVTSSARGVIAIQVYNPEG